MNLYLISQNHNGGYDSFDSAVVCADSEDEARLTHPRRVWGTAMQWDGIEDDGTWAPAKYVQVKLVGVAAEGIKKGVVCGSFNAG